MAHHWSDYISNQDAYNLINWSHGNNVRLLQNKHLKDKPFYRDSYKCAELHEATQSAVLDFLRFGTMHSSPDFGVWLDYWCWWSVLMTYAYNPFFIDDSGEKSTFHRLSKQLRLARDERLGVDNESPIDYVPPLANAMKNQKAGKPVLVNPINKSALPDDFFAPGNENWQSQLDDYEVAG